MSEHNLGCCFCVCIWPGILCSISIAYLPTCVGSLESEGRTSAQRKNRAGCEHSVDCWLFAFPDKSDLLARPLCKWGCLEHVLSRDVTSIPRICRSQAWSGCMQYCLVQMLLDFQESWLLWKPNPWLSGCESLLSCRIKLILTWNVPKQ